MTETKEVRIETSTLCNYSCEFCPHHTHKFNRKKEIMSQEMFSLLLKKVKEEAPEIDTCTISGFGESFIDNDLVNKVRFAKELGYKVLILTNGSLASRSILDELRKLEIESLRFSLHTIVKETYVKLTGGTGISLGKTMDSIDYAIKIGIPVIITGQVVKDNENEVDTLIKHYKGRNVLIELWKPHNWTDWGNYRSGEAVRTTCGRPFNGPLQIQVDGTINMCCFDFNGKLLLGDFRKQTLKEIFSSEEYLEIKKHHEEGTIKNSSLLCKNCDQLLDQGKIMVYNNRYDDYDRIGKTSTSYTKIFLEEKNGR